MYLTQDELLALATGPATQGDVLLKQLQCELTSLRQEVQTNKQGISALRARAVGGIDDFRPPEVCHVVAEGCAGNGGHQCAACARRRRHRRLQTA